MLLEKVPEPGSGKTPADRTATTPNAALINTPPSRAVRQEAALRSADALGHGGTLGPNWTVVVRRTPLGAARLVRMVRSARNGPASPPGLRTTSTAVGSNPVVATPEVTPGVKGWQAKVTADSAP